MTKAAKTSTDPQGTKRRQSIQSVEIGLIVLDALVYLGKASPLSQVAQHAGMSAPQTHRYLGSLINAGMARQEEGSGYYKLGPAALRLGLAALALSDVYRIADDEFSAFSSSTGKTVLVAALASTGPVIVRWYAGSPPVVTSLSVGSSLPVLRSATGQIFLAFVPEPEIEAIVRREQQAVGLTPVSVQAVRAEVRARGYAEVDGSLIPGLRAIAMPIIDMQGRSTLAATLLSTDGFTRADDAATRHQFAEVCGKITHAIGGTVHGLDS